jgi:hypothetical protein
MDYGSDKMKNTFHQNLYPNKSFGVKLNSLESKVGNLRGVMGLRLFVCLNNGFDFKGMGEKEVEVVVIGLIGFYEDVFPNSSAFELFGLNFQSKQANIRAKKSLECVNKLSLKIRNVGKWASSRKAKTSCNCSFD